MAQTVFRPYFWLALLNNALEDACYVRPPGKRTSPSIRENLAAKEVGRAMLAYPEMLEYCCDQAGIHVSRIASRYAAQREAIGDPLNKNERASLRLAGWEAA